jgi:tetratricopeptide (TPR) repeat protein
MKEKEMLKKHGNVVLFPGTTERLLEQARALAENYQYNEANELFENAFQLTEGDELSLSIYAYSLYETKKYERAKEICENLLALGPNNYFEVMELYLTICMQLRQFKQVEKIIESLLDEEAIPFDQVEKFQRIKKLNADIAQNQDSQLDELVNEEEVEEEFEFDVNHFLQLPLQQQLMQIHDLTDKNIRPLVEQLKQIVESESIHPFIQSLVLILLVEQEVNINLTIQKFGRMKVMNPIQMDLPTKLPQFQEITSIILEKLEQDPSTLEFVQFLISKHAIVLYPYEWLDYDSEDVAISYIDLVKTMFGEIKEMDYEIVEFLQNLEKMTELQE